jgi:cysteine sulfinate desulfinase/cysteine desulfurase-like protein
MGFSEQRAGEVLRFNCGRFVSDDDLDRAADKIARALQ